MRGTTNDWKRYDPPIISPLSLHRSIQPSIHLLCSPRSKTNVPVFKLQMGGKALPPPSWKELGRWDECEASWPHMYPSFKIRVFQTRKKSLGHSWAPPGKEHKSRSNLSYGLNFSLRYTDGEGQQRVCGGVDLKNSQYYPTLLGRAVAELYQQHRHEVQSRIAAQE